jgi:hypothetical protein
VRLLPWRRRRARLHAIGEAEAYHHSYGERSADVRSVQLPPRRPRLVARLSGEELRRKFLERLEAREPKE